MKSILLFTLVIASACVFAQSKDEQQIRSILDAQTKAWNAGDINAFMKGYWQNDSLMFIGSKGITYGYNATLTNYRKSYPDSDAMGQLTFTILSVQQLSPKACYVIGKWFLKREKAGDVGGHFTLLWKKINVRWVIVADHSS